jgi:hypothetical protein
MSGAGTADLFQQSASHFILSRVWLNNPNDKNAATVIAEAPIQKSSEIGVLSLPSEMLIVIWAVEQGSCVNMASDESALVLGVGNKVFRCVHDTVETPLGAGRRLHLIANDSN